VNHYFDVGCPKLPSPAPAAGKRRSQQALLEGARAASGGSGSGSASAAVEVIDILDDEDEEAAAAAVEATAKMPAPPVQQQQGEQEDGEGELGGDSDDEATQVPPGYEMLPLGSEEGAAAAALAPAAAAALAPAAAAADAAAAAAADAGMTPAEAALLAHLRECRKKPNLAPEDLWPKVSQSVQHSQLVKAISDLPGWIKGKMSINPFSI
jgi:hypothetical protein